MPATSAAAAAASGTTSGAPQTAAASEVTVRSVGGTAGRCGSEEEFGPAGGCGHLTKLVLKFTTASESDVQPSCEVCTCVCTPRCMCRYIHAFLRSLLFFLPPVPGASFLRLTPPCTPFLRRDGFLVLFSFVLRRALAFLHG